MSKTLSPHSNQTGCLMKLKGQCFWVHEKLGDLVICKKSMYIHMCQCNRNSMYMYNYFQMWTVVNSIILAQINATVFWKFFCSYLWGHIKASVVFWKFFNDVI